MTAVIIGCGLAFMPLIVCLYSLDRRIDKIMSLLNDITKKSKSIAGKRKKR